MLDLTLNITVAYFYVNLYQLHWRVLYFWHHKSLTNQIKIKVAFSKSCPVIKINLVESNSQDKGQCLPSSDTSEVAILQLSNEDILQINEGGWEIFWKKWWISCLFYERSDEFVTALLCACAQPAFSESRRAFAYACMFWWQICQKWIQTTSRVKLKN